MECADSRHATLCDADSRGFIVVAFCSAILHHWMCKIPTEVATLTVLLYLDRWQLYIQPFYGVPTLILLVFSFLT
ncbi:hypothetical protein Psal006b_01592 [Piscirickettsia salmonis]|uniref:Uncharacterized protein n=1 Tax=Piscirickettsia salmonis TaxID=1238 RepID=A0AAC8VI37_PISSA|nr:hypothetical protein KU39_1616 [Piscirickettsia salmonis]QGN98599.1 hypothetical protein Psal006b_01592 [Piscirickettsia salmonis]QGO02217.1 hypothetical protein Psal008_01604 [Piscirickettsia salmonis]QGO02219.1 hypothetical protein Psal008_01606 [Piscirickettsia salmonis]QGO12906.1 hypothetical protein Psal010b_01589 [Piscirickettsia salmonis]